MDTMPSNLKYIKPKVCIVPKCNSGTDNSDNAPNKIFFKVPIMKELKEKWKSAVGGFGRPASKETDIYCCEDHFDLHEDTSNFIDYYSMSVEDDGQHGLELKLKSDVVPHRFRCQSRIENNIEMIPKGNMEGSCLRNNISNGELQCDERNKFFDSDNQLNHIDTVNNVIIGTDEETTENVVNRNIDNETIVVRDKHTASDTNFRSRTFYKDIEISNKQLLTICKPVKIELCDLKYAFNPKISSICEPVYSVLINDPVVITMSLGGKRKQSALNSAETVMKKRRKLIPNIIRWEQNQSKCIAIHDRQRKELEIYYINSNCDITTYEKFCIIEHSTLSHYIYKVEFKGPNSRLKIIDCCCWYYREKFRPSIEFTKKPHICELYNYCSCCCRINPRISHNIHNQSSNTSESANVWVNEMGTYYRSLFPQVSFSAIQKALIDTRKIRDNSVRVKNEQYKSLAITINNEYYKIYNGYIVFHIKHGHNSELSNYTSDFNINVCCWYKREQFANDILKRYYKVHPSTVKFLKSQHLCPVKQCRCCCRPKYSKKLILSKNNLLVRHTTDATLKNVTIPISFSNVSKVSSSTSQARNAKTIGLKSSTFQSINTKSIGLNSSASQSLSAKSISLNSCTSQSLKNKSICLNSTASQPLSAELSLNSSTSLSLKTKSIGLNSSASLPLSAEVCLNSSTSQSLKTKSIGLNLSASLPLPVKFKSLNSSASQSLKTKSIGLSSSASQPLSTDFISLNSSAFQPLQTKSICLNSCTAEMAPSNKIQSKTLPPIEACSESVDLKDKSTPALVDSGMREDLNSILSQQLNKPFVWNDLINKTTKPSTSVNNAINAKLVSSVFPNANKTDNSTIPPATNVSTAKVAKSINTENFLHSQSYNANDSTIEETDKTISTSVATLADTIISNMINNDYSKNCKLISNHSSKKCRAASALTCRCKASTSNVPLNTLPVVNSNRVKSISSSISMTTVAETNSNPICNMTVSTPPESVIEYIITKAVKGLSTPTPLLNSNTQNTLKDVTFSIFSHKPRNVLKDVVTHNSIDTSPTHVPLGMTGIRSDIGASTSFVDNAMTATQPKNSIPQILERLKNVRINNQAGRQLTAQLDTPLNNLSTTELKVLNSIMILMEKKLKSEGLTDDNIQFNCDSILEYMAPRNDRHKTSVEDQTINHLNRYLNKDKQHNIVNPTLKSSEVFQSSTSLKQKGYSNIFNEYLEKRRRKN